MERFRPIHNIADPIALLTELPFNLRYCAISPRECHANEHTANYRTQFCPNPMPINNVDHEIAELRGGSVIVSWERWSTGEQVVPSPSMANCSTIIKRVSRARHRTVPSRDFACAPRSSCRSRTRKHNARGKLPIETLAVRVNRRPGPISASVFFQHQW